MHTAQATSLWEWIYSRCFTSPEYFLLSNSIPAGMQKKCHQQFKWNEIAFFAAKHTDLLCQLHVPKRVIFYIFCFPVSVHSVYNENAGVFLHVSNRIIRLNCIKFYVMANSDTNSQTVQHETVTNISFLANIYFFSSYKHRHQDCHFQGQTKKN